MANKHNDYKLKMAQNGNNALKTQKTKKLTFYLVVCAIIFCILGSILGSVAFVENRVANAELNPAITKLDFSKSNVGAPGMSSGVYIVSGGVTNNIGLTDYRNVGWANFSSDIGRIAIQKWTDLTSEGEGIVYNYPLMRFTCLNSNRSITPFITFSSDIFLAPKTSYVCNLEFFCDVNSLTTFKFYFLGGDKIDLLPKARESTIKTIENASVMSLQFVITNDTNDYLRYGSYRFDIKFDSDNKYFTLFSNSIAIADYYAGFEDGYKDGFDSANKDEYNWFNLFGSLIDVPIKAFTNLFNFEVFGQNLTNFFLAIFTFAVIIKVIQLLL